MTHSKSNIQNPKFSLPRYDRYKDSGIEWVDQIPAHWDVKPGRVTLSLNKEKNSGNIEETVLSLSYGRLVIKPPEKMTGLVPESLEGYQIINPGDIIIRPTDLQNDWTSLRVGLAKDRGIITSAYLGLKHDEKVSSEYLYYLLHSYDLLKVYYGMGTGLRQNLSWDDFKYLPLTVPPKPEQDRIVAFLDQKTAEIDALIAKKQRQIELLDEQKAILINRAVTRGLNPNTKLKPSGIEWIGEIPEHWEVKRFRYLYRSVSRWDRDGTEDKLSVTQKNGLVKTSEMVESSTQAVSFDEFQLCHPGDLVLNKYKAHLGVFWASNVRGIVTNNYTVLGPIAEVNPAYIETLFHTALYKWKFSTVVYGIVEGMMPLYTKDLYGVETILPPKAEQDAIMDHLDSLSARFLELVSSIERQIQILKTLRGTLIAHAVTGRIKV